MSIFSPAEIYESYVAPALFRPQIPHLLRFTAPTPGERILDVGCGTGIVARQAASLVGQAGSVDGADPNPAFLAVAQMAAADEGLSVTWHECPAEEMPFDDESFDLVLCQQALQHMADKPRALAEMRRVLRAGGRIGASVWQDLERQPLWVVMNAAAIDHAGVPIQDEAFALSDPADLRGLFTNAGFKEIEIEPVSFVARYPDPNRAIATLAQRATALVASVRELDGPEQEALIEAMSADMSDAAQEYTVDGHLEVPSYIHMARARRRSPPG